MLISSSFGLSNIMLYTRMQENSPRVSLVKSTLESLFPGGPYFHSHPLCSRPTNTTQVLYMTFSVPMVLIQQKIISPRKNFFKNPEKSWIAFSLINVMSRASFLQLFLVFLGQNRKQESVNIFISLKKEVVQYQTFISSLLLLQESLCWGLKIPPLFPPIHSW